MPLSQGDVVLVPFPFTDQTGNKRRPAVIVSNRSINNSDDVILAQITTQPISGPLGKIISNQDVTTPFKPPHTSMNVYCKKIAVIDKSLICGRITKISNEQKLNEILTCIKSLFNKDKR
jgi:mRNA interferase MazF